MIAITKPEQIPAKLIDVQRSIADQLFRKKENFDWRSEHYNKPVKEDLKILYNNKCAFCEVKLTEFNYDNQFTIEHYRPKDHYYWLGAEWTNLFPTCIRCNGKKRNSFPINNLKKKLKKEEAPFDENGQLILEKCNARYDNLMNEQPLFLHPEIDKPEKYFEFNPSGKVLIKSDLPVFEKKRAEKMLEILNQFCIEEKRKEKIKFYQDKLINNLLAVFPLLKNEYTDEKLKIGFAGFFRDLKKQKEHNAEFSLLGYYMIKDFDKFFLEKIEKDINIELKKLVERAYNLCID